MKDETERLVYEQSTLDVTTLGLRAYYIHPESQFKYVSFPVTTLSVDVQKAPKRRFKAGKSRADYIKSGFMGTYSATIPDDAEALFDRYGLSDYISEYFIGVFRESDDIVADTLLDHLSPWDEEETGVLRKFIGTTGKVTKPFEYKVDSTVTS